MPKINYGLNLELEEKHQSADDDVFGALSQPCIAPIPEKDREMYLPKGELQNIGEEKMDCATRGPINILETKFNWLYRNNKISPANRKWLEDNSYVNDGEVKFSDAFIAIKSNTTRKGNSLKAPLQAIHDNGLVPKKTLPQVEGFNDYYNPRRITREIEKLGLEFRERFPIRYERVYAIHFNEIYEEDMIDMAGHAWSLPVDGIYLKTDEPINHVFVGIRRPPHIIFDNYTDSVDGDFIKNLAENYRLFEYGYRLYIEKEVILTKPSISLIELFKKLLWIF